MKSRIIKIPKVKKIWKINPATRVVKSRKVYDRKRSRRGETEE